jgi:hypothetical protein
MNIPVAPKSRRAVVENVARDVVDFRVIGNVIEWGIFLDTACTHFSFLTPSFHCVVLISPLLFSLCSGMIFDWQQLYLQFSEALRREKDGFFDWDTQSTNQLFKNPHLGVPLAEHPHWLAPLQDLLSPSKRLPGCALGSMALEPLCLGLHSQVHQPSQFLDCLH